MKIIGITGGIGSGKSTVAKVFNFYDVPVFTADTEGKIISDCNPIAVESIKKLFGNDIYVDGKLNRKSVAAQVFEDKDKLLQLNQIIHPLVKLSFDNFCNKNANKSFVAIESAILIESGFYNFVDFSVMVSAPESLRIKRVVLRDGLTPFQVESRINNQLQEVVMEKFCKYKILNDDKSLITPQVKKILDIFSHIKNS